MKQRLSVLLVIILVLELVYPFSFMIDETDEKANGYNDTTNTFEFITDTPLAQGGVTFKTLGFKFAFTQNGEVYSAYVHMKDYKHSEPYDQDGKQWITNYFHVPLGLDNAIKNENIKSIYEAFYEKYHTVGSKYYSDKAIEDINDFFSHDNVIERYAVLTSKINGVEQGSFGTDINGDLTPIGVIWASAEEFRASQGTMGWSFETIKSVCSTQYFGATFSFPAQPINAPTPVITSYDASGNPVNSNGKQLVFKEGEVINIDASLSKSRPSDAKEVYEWTYQRLSSGVPIDKQMPNKGFFISGFLPVGDYQITLKGASLYKRPWDSSEAKVSSDPVYATLHIIPNEAPNATARVTVQERIKLEKDQYSVTVPIELKGRIENINVSDILTVELQLSTQEEDWMQKQVFSPTLTPSLTRMYTLSYNGESKTQFFKGKTLVTLKGGGVIESAYDYAYTTIYKELELNTPPVAILSMPEQSSMGGVSVSGRYSYDSDDDGYIVSYDFEVPMLGTRIEGDKRTVNIDFKALGTYQVILGVTDNKGARSETNGYIKIEPPSPNIALWRSGTYKENRTITLKAENDYWNEYYAPVGNNFKWTIKPMGSVIPQSDIIMTSNYGKNIDIMFRKKGKYIVTCTGTNGFGKSDTETLILNIVEDKPPVTKLRATSPVHRNEEKNATITVDDASYSTDGDYIGKRDWYYIFDSNNDGSFEGEAWHYIKTSTEQIDTGVSFNVNHVGKYEIYLAVTETFGEPTMPQYLTESDYKKVYATTVVEVDNIAPMASAIAVTEKKIDVSIVTDYEGDDLVNLQARMNQFKIEGSEHFRNINFNIVSDKQIIGKKVPDEIVYRGYQFSDNDKTFLENVYESPYKIAGSSMYNYHGEFYALDSNYVSLKIKYGNYTVDRSCAFGSDIKAISTQSNMRAYYVLLENGDLYMAGTDTEFLSTTSPRQYFYERRLKSFHRVMTQVKSIRGYRHTYVVKNDGTVWIDGSELGDAHSDHNGSTENRWYFSVPESRLGSCPSGHHNDNQFGTRGFQQIPGFSNVEKIEVLDKLILAKTYDNQFYTAGENTHRVGGEVRSGDKGHPNSIDHTQYLHKAPIAIKVNVDAYGFVDILRMGDKICYKTADNTLYEVTANTPGWSYVHNEWYTDYIEVEDPFVITAKKIIQTPSDFVQFINGSNFLLNAD